MRGSLDATTESVPNSNEMMNDLKSGRVQAQLLLVDTFERLSRADDNAELRRKLARLGVLVLTADSQFQDPTTASGQALALSRVLSSHGRRASESSQRTCVARRDAVRQGHWPGGPPPFGFRLENVMATKNGTEYVHHRVLVPVREHKSIVEWVFRLAGDKGLGPTRICKQLNADPQIPDELKPFLNTTISRMLDNELYFGEMVWGRNRTGIVDDVRILQSVDSDEWLINPEFCEGIVPRELWARAKALREARSHTKARKATESEGLEVVPPAPGIPLRYPLTGLVICSCCGRSMQVSSSTAYITVDGQERRYISYGCPGHASGVCENNRRIPEPWLRETVFSLLRERLFLHSTQTDEA